MNTSLRKSQYYENWRKAKDLSEKVSMAEHIGDNQDSYYAIYLDTEDQLTLLKTLLEIHEMCEKNKFEAIFQNFG